MLDPDKRKKVMLVRAVSLTIIHFFVSVTFCADYTVAYENSASPPQLLDNI